VGWVASLDPVKELNLAYLGVLFGRPKVACVTNAGVLLLSTHWWVGEVDNPSLCAVDFHSENTT